MVDRRFIEKLQRGDIVTVELYGGKTGQRRVVEVLLADPRIPRVHICAESEWQLALEENREPVGLAFPESCIAQEPADETRRGCNGG